MTASKPATKLIAPEWHTWVLIAGMVGYSLLTARSKHRLSASWGRPGLYLFTIAFEVCILAYVTFGLRSRGVTLRQITGGRWSSMDDVVRDAGIAALSWLAIGLALAGVGFAFHMNTPGKAQEMKRAVDFLVPRTRLDLGLWLLLSVTAGVCEEIIFRGYLQRQLAALTGAASLGVILQAIVFGLAHGYEGWQRMLLVGVLGAMLGALALWRKSLRPGMMVHAWQDAMVGAAHRFFLK